MRSEAEPESEARSLQEEILDLRSEIAALRDVIESNGGFPPRT